MKTRIVQIVPAEGWLAKIYYKDEVATIQAVVGWALVDVIRDEGHPPVREVVGLLQTDNGMVQPSSEIDNRVEYLMGGKYH